MCCVEGPAGGALEVPQPHKPTLKSLAPPSSARRATKNEASSSELVRPEGGQAHV